ncbi:hypothetical protein B0H14DRAFT_276766 [Mycena olivaceomarginata]|nr:hypothetical protein B0H14DRAFT_276766 [Mycena olivaceomarginata]
MGRPAALYASAPAPAIGYRLSPSYRSMPPVHHASPPLLHTRPWSSTHTQERLGEEVDRDSEIWVPRCSCRCPRDACSCAARFGVDAACGQAAVGTRCGKRRGWKKNRKRTTRDWVVCFRRARVLPCGLVVLRIAGSPLFISPPAYLYWTGLVTLHLGAARDSSCCTELGIDDNNARVWRTRRGRMFHLRCMYTATPPTRSTNTATCSTAPRPRELHLLGYMRCPAAPRTPLGGPLPLPYPRGIQGRIRHPHFLLPRPFRLPSAFLTVGCRVGWGEESGG